MSLTTETPNADLRSTSAANAVEGRKPPMVTARDADAPARARAFGRSRVQRIIADADLAGSLPAGVDHWP